jgi:hypothetical protein
MASHNHQPVSTFAPRKPEESARAFDDFRELQNRARRGNRNQFQAAMTQVWNLPPRPGGQTVPPRPAKTRIVPPKIQFDPELPTARHGKIWKSVNAAAASSI